MATIDTVKEVLQENLDIDPETVQPESTLESLGIDSLDMVELDLRAGGALRHRVRRARGHRHHRQARRLHREPVRSAT